MKGMELLEDKEFQTFTPLPSKRTLFLTDANRDWVPDRQPCAYVQVPPTSQEKEEFLNIWGGYHIMQFGDLQEVANKFILAKDSYLINA